MIGMLLMLFRFNGDVGSCDFALFLPFLDCWLEEFCVGSSCVTIFFLQCLLRACN